MPLQDLKNICELHREHIMQIPPCNEPTDGDSQAPKIAFCAGLATAAIITQPKIYAQFNNLGVCETELCSPKEVFNLCKHAWMTN